MDLNGHDRSGHRGGLRLGVVTTATLAARVAAVVGVDLPAQLDLLGGEKSRGGQLRHRGRDRWRADRRGHGRDPRRHTMATGGELRGNRPGTGLPSSKGVTISRR
jgi:hypothetical protein